MTRSATAIPHLKMHGFSGDHLLARCEDAGCTVDEHGNADCGRFACPSCGFSGSNVSAPALLDGPSLAECSCGHAWIPEPQPARVAA
jgi:hypothetical protein